MLHEGEYVSRKRRDCEVLGNKLWEIGMESFGENVVGWVVIRHRVDLCSIATLVRERKVVGHCVQFAGEVLGTEAAPRADHHCRDLPSDKLNGFVIPGLR